MSVPAPASNPFNTLLIKLPENPKDLKQALFPLHRIIEQNYRSLPWPPQMERIAVVTEVRGGRGDISAAAKAIGVMQKIAPNATFDWVVTSGKNPPPLPFLNCKDPSRVHVRGWQSNPTDTTAADFLLTGPVGLTWSIPYMEARINKKIAGPLFGFIENAGDDSYYRTRRLIEVASSLFKSRKEIYSVLHTSFFPKQSGAMSNRGQLAMGLEPGTGVFLDTSRIHALKSRGHCCPAYLKEIQDEELRKDILQATGSSEPDYDRYSFNSGYAHLAVSWDKFIDCVALHEREKHVVIVANHHGAFDQPSQELFCEKLFTPDRIAFLKKKGYGTITFKGQGGETVTILNDNDPKQRKLAVIVRPSFSPIDMKCLQLASERILATGDNSAVEAWCSRCKLYLYEDVASAGSKWRFLQQQVDLAKTISPDLSKLLALFGGDRRLPNSRLNEPLSQEQMSEIEKLLKNPEISNDTIKFCEHITENYSFEGVLESALKRTAWRHLVPELLEDEMEVLGDEFQTDIINYLKNPKATTLSLNTKKLSELAKRVQEVIIKRFPPQFDPCTLYLVLNDSKRS